MAVMADQPFRILLELIQEHKLGPWDVDIEELAEVFIQRLRKNFDLRVSGRTLLSASKLLRMKSEWALNGGWVTLGGEAEPEDFLDPDLPELGQISIVQRSPRNITLPELVDLLHETLGEIPPQKPNRSRKLEKIVQTLSGYHVNIEKYLEGFYQRIKSLAVSGRGVLFSELIGERTKLAVARALLLLLFLCVHGRVILCQEEPFGEILVSLPDG